MKHLILKTLLILLAICFITGCQQPVGIVTQPGGGSGMEFMWLVPTRLLYETYDRFDAQDDLQILVAEDGAVKEIPHNSANVTIEIIENPGMASESTTIISSYYPFSLPGRHVISVKYNDKTARYSIEVRGTYTGGGDGSDFLDLIWL